MTFPYRHFLILRATGEIGTALAARLVESGAKVTVVGRRQDRLDGFVQNVGATRAKGERFDIAELAQIPDFVTRVIPSSPDIDAIVLSAGLQNPYDLVDLDKSNLTLFHEEVKINISIFVSDPCFFALSPEEPEPNQFRLVRRLTPVVIRNLPLARSNGCISTGSNLAIVPTATFPAYPASKAALNVSTLCLREQLYLVVLDQQTYLTGS